MIRNWETFSQISGGQRGVEGRGGAGVQGGRQRRQQVLRLLQRQGVLQRRGQRSLGAARVCRPSGTVSTKIWL